MKNQTFKGIMIHHERRNNSMYGNPKYYGVFQNENGVTLGATTATNASCAYEFLNYQDRPRTITYHTTKAGNVIITKIDIESEVK